jgi:hypothetical protein
MAAYATTPTTANTPPGHTAPQPQLDCIAEDYAALNTTIPDDFWHEMRDQHLVAANAPLPIDPEVAPRKQVPSRFRLGLGSGEDANVRAGRTAAAAGIAVAAATTRHLFMICVPFSEGSGGRKRPQTPKTPSKITHVLRLRRGWVGRRGVPVVGDWDFECVQ